MTVRFKKGGLFLASVYRYSMAGEWGSNPPFPTINDLELLGFLFLKTTKNHKTCIISQKPPLMLLSC